MSISGGVAIFPKRLCVFVDGENFRYSLGALFHGKGYGFDKHNYLPDSDWTSFFRSFIGRQWELIRIYWYVTREIDVWPAKVPFPWEQKRQFFSRHKVIEKLKSQGVEGVGETESGLRAAEQELSKRSKSIQAKASGWSKIHTAIERQNDQVEFRRVGSIRFDAVENKFGKEKGVDTQLATDMITLADIYDVALVVSGDADYIPPVSAVKNRGKLVYSVSFLTEDGNKLPGGAVRLERRVDGRIELPFVRVRDKLGLAKQTKKRTLFQKNRGSEDPEAIVEVKP